MCKEWWSLRGSQEKSSYPLLQENFIKYSSTTKKSAVQSTQYSDSDQTLSLSSSLRGLELSSSPREVKRTGKEEKFLSNCELRQEYFSYSSFWCQNIWHLVIFMWVTGREKSRAIFISKKRERGEVLSNCELRQESERELQAFLLLTNTAHCIVLHICMYTVPFIHI